MENKTGEITMFYNFKHNHELAKFLEKHGYEIKPIAYIPQGVKYAIVKKSVRY